MARWRVSTQWRREPYVLQKEQFVAGDLSIEGMLAGAYWPGIRLAGKGRPAHFQHDKATARAYAGTAKWLDRHMPGRITKCSEGGADANVLDYSLSGQLEEKAWMRERKTRMELVASAEKRLREIPLAAMDDAVG